MVYRSFKTHLLIAGALAVTAAVAGSRASLPLKPGSYVVSTYAPCTEAPLAGVIEFDGKALFGPHESSCTTSVLSRQGDSYRLSTVCRAHGDGSPSAPSTWLQTVRIDSPTGLTVIRGDGATSYALCPAFR